MPKFQCSRCLRIFCRQQRLNSHMNRKYKCRAKINNDVSDQIHACQYCGLDFNKRYNCERHEARCSKNNKTNTDNEIINALVQEVKDLRKKIDEKPSNVHNNILQVLCVSGEQNYLDMLTEEWGDYDLALKFIKNCALSDVTGDCKLLERIYFDDNEKETPIRYIDRHRKKLEYVDGQKKRVIDHKGQQLCRILASNLQNSYLKGVNYLIKRNLEGKMCPNKFLENYDVQRWNQHIYRLSDDDYQKKILNSLNIPDL